MTLATTHPKSIQDAAQETLAALSALDTSAANSASDTAGQRPAHRRSDEVERLEIWIGEHGVRSGRLDHRLREASNLRGQVLFLLEKLTGEHAI